MSLTTSLTEVQTRAIDQASDDFIERTITHGLRGTPSYISQTVMEFFRKLQPRIKMFIREHLIRSGSAFSLVLGRIVDGTMDILFGFIMTFIDFTARALISEAFWSSVKIVLTKVWEDFEEKGILAQTYNCSKALAMSILHAVKFSFLKAIDDKKLQLKDEYKAIIEQGLEKALNIEE